MSRTTIVASLALLSGAAHAEPTSTYPVIAASSGGLELARQMVPAPATTTGIARTHTIYLNRNGATLTPGYNDSQANTSSIVTRATQVPTWNPSASDWAATVACMRQIWSPFDIEVTDIDPGATMHVEALFARAPADVGLSGNIGGISPFSSTCSVIEGSIVFAFTDNLPRRPRAICEVMSQEVAHSFGLDHEMLASDPMTYLAFVGDRAFQDVDAPCGESMARPCGIGSTTCRPSQNSVQLLLARLGAANRDHQAPSVGITEPEDSATVEAGFAIAATVSDNTAVSAVAFYLDGDLLATRTEPPYEIMTDPAMVEGAHTIIVEATDVDGNAAREQREVTVAGPLDPFRAGCSTGREPAGAPILTMACLALLRRQRRSRQLGAL